jgi:hypothetical protein
MELNVPIILKLMDERNVLISRLSAIFAVSSAHIRDIGQNEYIFLEEKGKATVLFLKLDPYKILQQVISFLGQCQTPHAAQGFLTVK